jgi:TRAP-type mannitol/chloroaromatic compound transport system permease small subunit
MLRYIDFADKLSEWFGKAFAWAIMVMIFGVGYEAFVRRVMRDPTSWSFDISYMMYGALFMMAGAYTLSRDGHVRADFLYRLWAPRWQAIVDLTLYILFFFPGITALAVSGWRFAARAWGYYEVSINSPAGVPIYQFKALIVVAGGLMFLQGIAQVFRCIICIRTGAWPRAKEDVQELEKVLLEAKTLDVLHHGGEPADLPADMIKPAAPKPNGT